MLSQRVRTMEESATLAMNKLRLDLRAKGRKVFNFSVGEPDFGTPPFIRRAAYEALESGWTRYTAVEGVPELRDAVASHAGGLRGERIARDEVVITCGAKHACANVLLAIVDPGDEVLLPAPYWVSYPEMIRLADGIAVPVLGPRENGYRVTPELLLPKVTPRTVGLIVNSPGNPTGCVYNPREIAALVAFAKAHDLWILSDEIYDRFVFAGEFASPYRGEGRARTFLVGGLSKTCAMTGWRIGWAIGERETIAAIGRLQGHTTSNIAAVSQAAALAALAGMDDPALRSMVEEFARRRARVIALLSELKDVYFTPPEGAFYVFLDIGAHLQRRRANPLEFCIRLLEETGVALVPGDAFGDPRGVRLSYARPLDELEQGIHALASYLSK